MKSCIDGCDPSRCTRELLVSVWSNETKNMFESAPEDDLPTIDRGTPTTIHPRVHDETRSERWSEFTVFSILSVRFDQRGILSSRSSTPFQRFACDRGIEYAGSRCREIDGETRF